MSTDAHPSRLPARPVGRVTITDVARAAGVSVATVSKVVNGRYGVATATAQRVLEVIADLGYETSLVASSLRRGRTDVVGILLAGFDPFATELLKGISAEAVGKGYELLAYSGAISDDNAVGWERRSLSRLGGTLIDGAIILTPTVSLAGTSVPVISVDPHTGSGGSHVVDSDNVEGARAATRHLIELGHRRIAHIRGRTDLESAHRREQGYRLSLAEAGIPFDPDLVRDGGYRAAWTTEPARELLTMPDRPTAVFAANDLSAFGVIEVAHELGMRVPHDLSVVGFDDIPEAASASPRLTTIAQPLQAMGARAVTMLFALLDGQEAETHVRLPARLVVRKSTSPPPVL
ncbi:LacI family DNA-binding transcriptional regulator [Xylanimonas protaetiae]|uniref:LacI family transcriptional regulator n=1 Tax=Xylanimonas protaetiae TaxID=2509457 RepID=A0A4P6F2D2_9MICO|nr:LacI family DNA-binding transcriptional regulator [Xylanimonas protaetiae]QAY69702.1 LacI family transcriptional regulator [Xylanimonas protaetiae]